MVPVGEVSAQHRRATARSDPVRPEVPGAARGAEVRESAMNVVVEFSRTDPQASGSELQLRDVRAQLAAGADLGYLRRWASELSATELLGKLPCLEKPRREHEPQVARRRGLGGA